ncbi:MAG: hypothetical protein HFJ65_05320 [Eggerthellaceae bacterium]|nr:hypothetical protein [Eggerthellaceae bacterium]
MLNALSDYTKNNKNFIYGWILDERGNPTGSTCLISDSEERIEAIVPFDESNPNIAAWFTSKQDFFYSLESECPLPETIWIKSITDKDVYSMIDPRVISQTVFNMGLPALNGMGTIVPRYIVKGNAGVDYSKLNKVRSVYPELMHWTGLSSLESQIQPDPANPFRLSSYSVGFTKQEPIDVYQDVFTIKFVPYGAFSERHEPDTNISLWQEVALETSIASPVSLSDHMTTHCAVRNLVSILSWRGIPFERIAVKRADDETQFIDGTAASTGFCSLITDEYNTWVENDVSHLKFLFRFEAIGSEGLSKWLKLCADHSKITSGLYYLSANNKHIPIESKVIESCILLEEISEMLVKKNRDNSIESKILQVLSAIELYKALLPPYEDKKLAHDIACAYNSLKHTKPTRCGMSRGYWIDPVNLHDVSVACKSILQLWVARELGCSAEKIIWKPRDNPSVESSFKRIDHLEFTTL